MRFVNSLYCEYYPYYIMLFWRSNFLLDAVILVFASFNAFTKIGIIDFSCTLKSFLSVVFLTNVEFNEKISIP